jgi:hypothetical protein
MSQDVLRKLLGLIEKRAEVRDADLEAARVGGALVEVKKRASRRAVKQQLDTQIASARSAACSRKLIAWYNQSVGPALLGYADMGEGRRIHLLDTTQIVVAHSTGTYECSDVVKDEEGQLWRGYKLATLRSLLDTAGLLRSAIALEQIRTHRTHVIAYAGGYFEIFETLSFVHLVLSLTPEVEARLRHWLEDNLPNFQRRE